MSVNITFDGQSHIVAETGEVGWGGNTTSYLVAIAAGCLQKTGGSFTLSGETDFGADFGLKSLFYKSRTADISATGILRLANNSDSVSWRNAANSADLALAVNTSNQITFNGTPLATSGGGTVNLGTQFQLGYYATNGTEISGLGLITASQALASNVNGLPVASATTAAELGFVSGVTSSIQTQFNAKAPTANPIFTGVVLIADGSQINPALALASESDTGFFKSGTGVISYSSGGAEILRLATNSIQLLDGTPTNPAFGFFALPQTLGFYRASASLLGVTANGAQVFEFGAINRSLVSLGMNSTKITSLADGTAVQDAVAFGQVKILQVVTGNSSTDFSTTSNTFQTTNLSATITPSSTSSTILIFVNGALVSDDLTTTAIIATLFRGSTDLMTGGNGGFVSLLGPGLATSAVGVGVGTCFKDSPASTSALTYAVKIRNEDNTTRVRFGNARLATIILVEVNGL